MKKIIIALALLASVQVAFAQSKEAVAAQKAVAKAEADAQNPKKNTKGSTWMKLGEAYLKAYDAPTANVIGGTRQELALLLKEQPGSSEVVTLAGRQMEKDTYADKALYFDPATGNLLVTEVTAPVIPDALDKALAAYKKALELEPGKAKDIDASIERISQNYFNDGYTKYTLGDFKAASAFFGLAADAAAASSTHRVDTTSVYYAGVTALEGADLDAAEKYFKKAQSLGFDGEQGSVLANLATVSLLRKTAADTLSAKQTLEQGFAKYPESGQIMTNLINLYLATNESPERLIQLLGDAKKQMPDNASLYYVEGNVLSQLKRFDEAVAAYRQANEVDPNYVMGFYGEGTMYYNQALAIQEEAEALPYSEYKKYDELQEKLAESLKSAIAPFEKAFEKSDNGDVKTVCADYLKRLYFIFRSESEENQKKHEFYDAFLKGE